MAYEEPEQTYDNFCPGSHESSSLFLALNKAAADHETIRVRLVRERPDVTRVVSAAVA